MEYKNTWHGGELLQAQLCLNPCSNGIQKYTTAHQASLTSVVLILVLMEYKNTHKSARGSNGHHFVLILVLMEYKNTCHCSR